MAEQPTTTDRTFSLPSHSRYKDTDVLDLGNGGTAFGLFRTPEEVADLDRNALPIDRVYQDGEGPNLDAVAVRNYGPGFERAWWAIAAANGVVDADRQPGLLAEGLAIPSRLTLDAVQARRPYRG